MKLCRGIVEILAFSVLLGGCSFSKSKVEEIKHRELKKDFVVTDASLDYRPIWTGDIDDWANKYKIDVNEFRYFSYETEAKSDRETACKLANANAKSDIAGEITTFILENLTTTAEGEAAIDPNNPELASMKTYVETNLSQKIQASISGTSVMKTYWEKRNYKKELGASKDFTGFSCASLVRIKKSQLEAAIAKAGAELQQVSTGPLAKDRAKIVLGKVEKEFLAPPQPSTDGSKNP